MNILLDTLPETITVNGREYFADTDYRTMIIFEKIITDSSISSRDRVMQAIELVLPNEQPVEIDLAIKEILFLYSLGRPSEAKKRRLMNGNVEIKEPMIYDYEYDAPYIFGSFMAEYGIDLNAVEYLHWWKFVSLFRSLSDTCKISKIMGYRATDLSKISDKSERNRIAKLKKLYAIPQNLTYEDKVAMAGLAFGGH